jgi:hypothetical protein
MHRRCKAAGPPAKEIEMEFSTVNWMTPASLPVPMGDVVIGWLAGTQAPEAANDELAEPELSE